MVFLYFHAKDFLKKFCLIIQNKKNMKYIQIFYKKCQCLVDLEYLKKLHKICNTYPLVLGTMCANIDMLHSYYKNLSKQLE